MTPEPPVDEPESSPLGRGALTEDGTWKHEELTDQSWLSHPDAAAKRLRQGATTLDDVTHRRFSRTAVMGVLLVPLGCAFVVAFAIAIALIGGILAVLGLTESQLAGQIGGVIALLIAVGVVVAVFRVLILRFPRFRRLVNR